MGDRFHDTTSGASQGRSQFHRVLRKLSADDVLMVTKLGCLDVVYAQTAQHLEVIKRRDAGEPIREIVRSYEANHSAISRLAS